MQCADSVAFVQPEALEAAIASREGKLRPQLRGSLLFAGGLSNASAPTPTNSESDAQAQAQAEPEPEPEPESESEAEAEAEAEAESESESEAESESESESESASESEADKATIVIDDDEVHEPTAWDVRRYCCKCQAILNNVCCMQTVAPQPKASRKRVSFCLENPTPNKKPIVEQPVTPQNTAGSGAVAEVCLASVAYDARMCTVFLRLL